MQENEGSLFARDDGRRQDFGPVPVSEPKRGREAVVVEITGRTSK